MAFTTRERPHMYNRKLKVLLACSIALAILDVSGALAAKAKAARRLYPRHYASMPYRCPLHRTAEGEWVDCHGWRLRDNAIGWDNTCFNLDYLPSQFACSAGGR